MQYFCWWWQITSYNMITIWFLFLIFTSFFCYWALKNTMYIFLSFSGLMIAGEDGITHPLYPHCMPWIVSLWLWIERRRIFMSFHISIRWLSCYSINCWVTVLRCMQYLISFCVLIFFPPSNMHNEFILTFCLSYPI